MVERTCGKRPITQCEFRLDAKILRGSATARSMYIRNRCADAIGKTVRSAITKLHFKNLHGETKKYSMRDLHYDVATKSLVVR